MNDLRILKLPQDFPVVNPCSSAKKTSSQPRFNNNGFVVKKGVCDTGHASSSKQRPSLLNRYDANFDKNERDASENDKTSR